MNARSALTAKGLKRADSGQSPERLTTLEWRPPLDPTTSGEGARVVGQQEGAILDLADQSAPIARRLLDVARTRLHSYGRGGTLIA
jgi:hypothetical protein